MFILSSSQQMEDIISEYGKNRDFYEGLKKRVEASVQGRCCHHSVVCLNILVELFNIRTYLEIGVHNGTSMNYVVAQLKNPVRCIGVDLFENGISRYAHDKLLKQRTLENIQRLNISQSEIHLIQGNSRDAGTITKVRDIFKTEPVDLLFIDGDHEFAGVEADFLNYAPLIVPGGFIVFDDANSTYPGILKCIEKHVKSNPNYEILGTFENTDLIVRRKPNML